VNPRESKPEQLSLIVSGPYAIRQAANAARGFGEAQQLADDQLARLCIVVEELVANLYDHGGLAEQDDVQLSLAYDPGGIRIAIIDPGTPFDPWSGNDAVDDAKRRGGAGLNLIRAWTARIDYRSSEEGNRLELLLRFRRQD
jgi:anti-sigma regulatory factor (Ser/Thr protein kinase)